MRRLGSQLSPEVQKEALRRFVHRYTGTHKPMWAQKEKWKGGDYPVQFVDDEDWLAHTTFEVHKDGTLDHRQQWCESRPTWPFNPELKNPPKITRSQDTVSR
jgi:hypothetical protein